MKPIPCAFVRDPRTGRLTPEATYPWFARGEGFATRKWDGLPCLIAYDDEAGSDLLYKGVTIPREERLPPRFIQTGEPGEPDLRGWLPIRPGEEPYWTAIQLLHALGRPCARGTYELCGPGVKGNPEGLDCLTLIRHDLVTYLRTPRTLDACLLFLAEHDGEGLVWTYGDNRCQLTRKDVGLPWPI